MAMLLLKWTVWIALWLAVLSAWVRWARSCWIWGGVCLAVHVALAFHGVHHWDHPAAIAATAKQVESVTGMYFGWGIWANHLFLLAWAIVAWRWDRIGPGGRRMWWSAVLFMGLNATVIFTHGISRGLGIVWTIAAAVSAIRSGRSRAYAAA